MSEEKGEEVAPAATISQAERAAVYRAIYERRDVRDEFLSDEIPRETILRILQAAHHAPSVGFMQPWNFLLVRDAAVRGRIRPAFEAAVARETREIPAERQAL